MPQLYQAGHQTGRGEEKMEKILIGKIVNAVGLKGEIKVYCYTDRKEQFETLGSVWLEEESCAIERVRYQGNVVILKIRGIDDRNAAEKQKGKGVFIEESDLAELPEDTYYIRDLLGAEVRLEDESLIGTLSDVVQNSAQDLYEIRQEDGRKVLLPVVKEFVLKIQPEEGVIYVKLPDGLLEL